MKNRFFVYGTLLSSTVRKNVCGSDIDIEGNKILHGYIKKGLNIIEDKNSSVCGGIIEVNDDQLVRLNQYEGLGHLYHMIDVTVDGEKLKAYQLI